MSDHVFYANLKKNYPVVERGEGIYLWDTTGKRYIDACCGALVANIGHGVKEVARAIAEQAEAVAFAHRSQFTNKPLQRMAEIITSLAPEGIEWVNFVSGGSEATETAMKMAREYHIERGKPSKYKVVARWQSYHGNSMGALSMSGHVARRRRYNPMLIDFPHAAPCYCYRCPFAKEPSSCSLECADDMELTILREGPENVAAVILEPIVGSTIGAAVPKDGYLQRVRDVCDRYDVLLIADEVMTGLGRTGANFAVDHWNVVPDMICMAKGLSGGYAPMGAVAVQRHVYETFLKGSGKFAHGFTYGGNPLAAAAGAAVLEYVVQHDLVGNARRMGDYLLEGLRRLAGEFPTIGDVRGLGLMTAIEFVKDRATKEPFPPDKGVTDMVVRVAFETGMTLYPAPACADGIKGDAVMIAPPLTVTKSEIDMILEMLADVLAKCRF